MSIQTLKKWGHSAAVRIPVALMEATGLTVNQWVEVRAENGRLIVAPLPEELTLTELVAAITPENCHNEVDFGQVKGAEQRERVVWLHENREAIASYATLVDESGVFSDGERCF